MRVGDVCSKAVISAGPDMDASSAAKLMREHHVGTVVVVEMLGSVPIPTGIVTDRDLVVEVLAKQVEPEKVCLGDLVTSPLSTAEATDDVFETLARMRADGVRRMPVVDARKRLVGLLSTDDVVGALARVIANLPKLVQRSRAAEVAQRS
jgi:CBS domain-containing protein